MFGVGWVPFCFNVGQGGPRFEEKKNVAQESRRARGRDLDLPVDPHRNSPSAGGVGVVGCFFTVSDFLSGFMRFGCYSVGANGGSDLTE